MFTFKKKIAVLSLVAFGSFPFASVCYSQNDMQGRMEDKIQPPSISEKSPSIAFMGITGGANNSIGDSKTGAEIGVVAGSQQESGLGFGGEVNTTRMNDFDRTQRTSVLAQMAYKFGGDVAVAKDSYLAVGIGPAIVKNQIKWAVAPAVGFDIPLKNKVHDTVSLGLNAKYVGVTNSPDSYVGSAVVKYWY
jgi:hypothetical protein